MSDETSASLIPFGQDPLMQPISWEGQEYYLSQYFHRQYRENAGLQGKYRRHDDFRRLLRSIESYAMYLAQKDIIELRWEDVKLLKSELTPNMRKPLQLLFHATGYHPLILINAKAQAELTHHLDDELSKQMAYTANTLVARHAQVQQSPSQIDWRQSHLAFVKECMAFLDILGVTTEYDKHRAAQEVRFLLGDSQLLQLSEASGPAFWTVEQRVRFLKYPTNTFLSRQWKSTRTRIGSKASRLVLDATGERPKKVWREVDGQYMEVTTYPPETLHHLDAAIRQILGTP